MNERLHELIEETVDIYMKRNVNGTVPQRDYLFQEIFAQLIINDCCRVIDNLHEAYDAPTTSTFIKQYYGVKE